MTQLQLPHFDADSKNLDWFWNGFAHLTGAPNGVAKLRELILGLAVQGKLVPQDENDEPASELLKRIAAEKARLVGEKKIPRLDLLPPISVENAPFSIPTSWQWVRLGDVFQYDAGNKCEPNSIPNDVWLLELEDIEKNTSRIIQRVTFDKRNSKSTKNQFLKDDVLYGKLRPYLNKVVVADSDGFSTTEIVSLRSYLGANSAYLKYFMRSPSFTAYISSKTYGTKMPRLGTSDAKLTVFPFPPENEQTRIVARVDELMALCDQLEAHQKQQRSARDEALQVNLNRLVDAADAEAFTARWEALNTRFETLFDAPETVAPLRAAILQLAVQGKLEPQNPDDEPASVLLEQIATEKARLVAEKKLRKSEPLPAIDVEKIPFEIPQGWEWVRLGEVVRDFQNGLSKRSGDKGDLIPVIRLADIKNFRLSEESLREIMLTPHELEHYRVNTNDTLIIRCNGSADLVGRFVVSQSSRDWAYCDHLIRMRLLSEFVDASFVSLISSVGPSREHIVGKTVTTAGQKTINQSGLSMLPIPLPPLAEQKRIVARVDALMALCDELEAGLKAAVRDSEEMAAVTVRAISAGQFS